MPIVDMEPATAPTYTVRQRRQLMQRTQDLGPTEHEEIFKIIRDCDVEHTQNNNGVFVNLTRVSDDVVDRVRRFVDFCIENKQDLDAYDKRLNECKLMQSFDKLTTQASEFLAPAGKAPTASEVSAQTFSVAGAKRMTQSRFHLAKKYYTKKRVSDRRTAENDASANELVPDVSFS